RRIESFATLASGGAETNPNPGRTALSANPGGDSGRAQIETALLKSVGPIAKILMARISPQCSTANELRDRLAAQITDPKERTTFLKHVAAAQPSGGPNQPSMARPLSELMQWDPSILATAKQLLAVYTGPIASVIVERASRRAQNPHELYELLAQEISSERD